MPEVLQNTPNTDFGPDIGEIRFQMWSVISHLESDTNQISLLLSLLYLLLFQIIRKQSTISSIPKGLISLSNRLRRNKTEIHPETTGLNSNSSECFLKHLVLDKDQDFDNTFLPFKTPRSTLCGSGSFFLGSIRGYARTMGLFYVHETLTPSCPHAITILPSGLHSMAQPLSPTPYGCLLNVSQTPNQCGFTIHGVMTFHEYPPILSP